ncbi:hypothetical protein L6452_39509 [Arctium lappa]|uniref:Uncharacterized protein n=1 Tax=Arctium lappa TaxID=4217 RepID=A0ACB8XT66_ARCLA|nr:hypothetical protein L6452_39509 [Arctium lappa]
MDTKKDGQRHRCMKITGHPSYSLRTTTKAFNFHHHNDDRETYKERAASSPVSSGIKPAAMGGFVAVKWWISYFKLSGGIVSCIWKFSVIRGGLLRLFNLPLVGSMVLLLLFYLRFRLFRRRRRLRREAIDELLGVIKEKDEKMQQLLHQIARMNELLLATHHGVPIISKAASS